MKRRKVAIIGHFGGNESFTDGQTVKTKILYNELSNATDWKISKIDTYYKSKKPIGLLLETIRSILTTRDIIVLLSGNGMKFYFPLLWLSSRLFRTRIYHDVIGGNLDTYLRKYPTFKMYLNEFKNNWVETESLRRKVESCGVTNCEVIPNFKRLNIVSESELIKECKTPFAFCTFSRVMKEKGIEEAINAVESINKENGKVICTLDIYGMIDAEYRERFQKVLTMSTDAVQYKGVVPFDKSVETIKGYFALLFPTYWSGEGFPGTIVDAFSAGLPVIATNWNSNAELVENEVTGIVYPNDKISDLKSAMEWIIANAARITTIKRNCVRVAEEYQPDSWIKHMVAEMEK